MTTTPPASATPDDARRDDTRHRYTAALANEIEQRWQTRWASEETFRTPNPGDPGFDPSRPKFFCMDMFPYPSGAGLHVGHPLGYIASDIVCRHRRMRGFNVLHPMGWDAFGLPAEQYAIQTGIHPAQTTRTAIETFRGQLQRFGFSYDWSREFATIDPDYFRWTQWIWLQAYDAWYDVAADRARPIAELIQDLENGTLYVGPSGELVPGGLAGHLEAIGGAPIGARKWHDLDQDERRDLIDDQRLAYLSEQTVNWCPKLGTALANEEVIDGKSERGWHPVYRRPLKQWMFRITAYADRLLRDLDGVDWPESTRAMQKAWIGRSEGAEIDFPLADLDGSIRVFTTRPDTVFGATYMVLAPEHPLVETILDATPDHAAEVRAYVDAARNRSDVDRMADTKTKTGAFTGGSAVNPATGERIPVWVADYVLMGYGHGAIMAVPGHDQRDFDFAKVYDLPIIAVVQPDDAWLHERGVDATTFPLRVATLDEVFAGDGVSIDSANDDVTLTGRPTADAKATIITWLESIGAGRGRVNFKLRDWLFSRQRYWGEPFPIVFANGRHYPVDPAALPVALPDLKDYEPVESDDPTPLLGKATDWVHTTAGEAGVSPDVLPPDTPVVRETNTMPGWAGSCWYYLRYADPHAQDRFVSRAAERYWMVSPKRSAPADAAHDAWQPGVHHTGGVDLYIGGAEHATLHLLYARFWHKILFDLGEVSTPEPFGRLFHQGLLTAYAYQRPDRSLVPVDQVEEREGPGGDVAYVEIATGAPVERIVTKMSKTLKNVINPDDIIAEYGADTFRLYEMYMGPLDASKPWNTRDIIGPLRFLQRLWRLAVDEATGALSVRDAADPAVEKALHRTIAKVGEDIERLAFNTAIAALIEFVNVATASGGCTHDQLERLALTIAPLAPHIAEELWSRLGHDTMLAHESWPTHDPALLVDDEIELPVQIKGKVRARIMVPIDADAATIEALALADPRITECLAGATVRKTIVVPGKIVNIIT